MKSGVNHTSAWWAGVAILLLTIVVYWPAYSASFHWDDDQLITENPLITQPGGLWKIWFSTEPLDYIPLTSTLFWIEYRLFGLNPMPYHVVNVLLHAVSAVGLWLVLRRLGLAAAWLGAALFAVHPVVVSTGAWVAEGKNTVAMVFAMASLLAMVQSNWIENERFSRRWYVASIGLFILALLAKAAVVMLAPALLVLIWWKRGRLVTGDLLRAAPYFVLSLIFGLITVWFQTHRSIGEIDPRPEGWLSRIAGVGWCAWFYMGKVILPINITMVYPRWDIPGSAVAMIPLVLLVVILGALCITRNRYRGGRGVVAALAIYFLMLLPVLGLVKMAIFQHSLVADHLQYFAVPAATALIGSTVIHLLGKSNLSASTRNGVVGALVLVCGAMAFERSRYFETHEILWTDVIAKNPQSPLGYFQRASSRAANGLHEKAVLDYRAVLAINPEYDGARFGLGTSLAALGLRQEAIVELQRVCAVANPPFQALNNLGNALVKVGRIRESIEVFDRAILRKPQDPELHYNRSIALQKLGQVQEAMDSLQQAIRLAPDHVGAMINLGALCMKADDLQRAEFYFRSALNHEPEALPAVINLATLYQRQHRFAEAHEMIRRAHAIDPNHPAVQQIMRKSLP